MDDRCAKGGPRFDVLALLWHSPHVAVTAGGFKRTYEIFKRVPDSITLRAIDNSPSFLSDIRSERIVIDEYSVPGAVRMLEKRFYRVERMIERLLSFASLVLMSARLKKEGRSFDAILVPYSEIVAILAAGVAAKSIFGKRLVLVNHNIEHFSPLLRKAVVALHNRADLVIAVSEDLKQRLVRYGVRTPVAVNSNGLDAAYIEGLACAAGSEKSYDAVFVGRHVEAKGIVDLVKAWAVVAAKLPSARLLMLGSCDAPTMSRLRALAERLGIAEQVTIGGIVDEEEKYALVSSSKMLLFPSYMEGWGLVPQEGLACGLPVVVYDLPVYRENIAPCGAVFTVPAGDYHAMARVAIGLIADDAYREHCDEGRDFVKRFSWERIAEREYLLLTGGLPGGQP